MKRHVVLFVVFPLFVGCAGTQTRAANQVAAHEENLRHALDTATEEQWYADGLSDCLLDERQATCLYRGGPYVVRLDYTNPYLIPDMQLKE